MHLAGSVSLTQLLGPDRGYLHRDISAGNVLIGKDGIGVLIDYDLAVRYPLEANDPLHSQRSVSPLTRPSARACRMSR